MFQQPQQQQPSIQYELAPDAPAPLPHPVADAVAHGARASFAEIRKQLNRLPGTIGFWLTVAMVVATVLSAYSSTQEFWLSCRRLNDYATAVGKECCSDWHNRETHDYCTLNSLPQVFTTSQYGKVDCAPFDGCMTRYTATLFIVNLPGAFFSVYCRLFDLVGLGWIMRTGGPIADAEGWTFCGIAVSSLPKYMMTAVAALIAGNGWSWVLPAAKLVPQALSGLFSLAKMIYAALFALQVALQGGPNTTNVNTTTTAPAAMAKAPALLLASAPEGLQLNPRPVAPYYAQAAHYYGNVAETIPYMHQPAARRPGMPQVVRDTQA